MSAMTGLNSPTAELPITITPGQSVWYIDSKEDPLIKPIIIVIKVH